MRFQVPQFIEHEAKVVGPLTFRQAIYLGVPIAIGFFFYFLAPFSLFLIVTVTLLGIAIPLAFFKIGGRSMLSVFAGFLQFSISPKAYKWGRKQQAVSRQEQTQYGQAQPAATPKATVSMTKGSKLGNLSTRVVTDK
tara:strand:+ start:134 stop:544 length:411 start_codon:yes stop_codon:yes gene_type:complete